jgi:hypothetical protein
MARAKTPPPYTWIAAPIGCWFKGPHGRKLAHIWLGSDQIWRGFVFLDGEQVSRGPFLTESSAMESLSDELSPKEVKP